MQGEPLMAALQGGGRGGAVPEAVLGDVLLASAQRQRLVASLAPRRRRRGRQDAVAR
jgi:hypothetical protein